MVHSFWYYFAKLIKLYLKNNFQCILANPIFSNTPNFFFKIRLLAKFLFAEWPTSLLISHGETVLTLAIFLMLSFFKKTPRLKRLRLVYWGA